jgi:hypothetical protein
MTLISEYLKYLPPAIRHLPWRAYPQDGSLLLFERNTGLNVLLEGVETQHFRRLAPRTLLIAVTNACNLTCSFCYRDLESRSLWRYENLLQFCQESDQWGVLEVAFGGGEPTLFPHWQEFIHELYNTTGLGLNFTTNGLLLTEDFLHNIAGKYGQIRVSLYEDNQWAETIQRLVNCGSRFGINWLITPADLPTMETKLLRLLSLGVRDFLLLSYKGSEPHMHLAPGEIRQLTQLINKLYQQLGSTIQLKLDVCWGSSLPDIPRLFIHDDCGAGDDFLSITSDKHVKVCSFQQTSTGIPFETLADVRTIWQQQRQARQAALIGGCARLPNRGLATGGAHSAYIDLAAIR